MNREQTLIGISHPQFIDNDWLRVDHPTVAPLQDGAPALGWEGDPRLVVYLHKPTQTFVLWRLEHDGEYRPTAKLPEGASITPESINRCIRNLQRVDQVRGFNAADDVLTKVAADEKAREAHTRDFIVDFADKLRAGLAWQHLPGISYTRPRFARRKG